VAEVPDEDGVWRGEVLQFVQAGHLRASRAEKVAQENTTGVGAGNEASRESAAWQRDGEPVSCAVPDPRHVR
jgi:hypothetical protein